MFCLTELIYAYDIIKSLIGDHLNGSPELIKVRYIHQLLSKSRLNLTSVHSYDMVYSLFDVNDGLVTFHDLIILLRGVACLQSDSSRVLSVDDLSNLSRVTAASLSDIPVQPFPPHILPSPYESYPTPELFINGLKYIQRKSPSGLPVTRQIVPVVFQEFKNIADFEQVVNLFSTSTQSLSSRLFLSSVFSSIPSAFFQGNDSPQLQPVANSIFDSSPFVNSQKISESPQKSPNCSTIKEVLAVLSSSSDDESVISGISYGSDRSRRNSNDKSIKVPNDGRFVSFVINSKTKAFAIKKFLNSRRYQWYPTSLKRLKSNSPEVLKVFITFKSLDEADRFISENHVIDGWKINARLLRVVSSNILERFPLD
ncbi:hypothetical protein GEMRC1_004076 [Eukaryota sp. GEM-RC1]